MKKIKEETLPADLLLLRPKGAKITRLNITKEQLDEITMYQNRHDAVRDVLNIRLCICGRIPYYECRTQVGDEEQPITKREFFCENCIHKVFARTREEEEIGVEEMYNFTKVEHVPPTNHKPWN